MDFFINPVYIIISCTSVPTFHYKCVLLITCNRDTISKNITRCMRNLYFGLHYTYMVINIRFSSRDFSFCQQVHCVKSQQSLSGSLCVHKYSGCIINHPCGSNLKVIHKNSYVAVCCAEKSYA